MSGEGRVAAKNFFKAYRLAGYPFAKMERARMKQKYNKTIQWYLTAVNKHGTLFRPRTHLHSDSKVPMPHLPVYKCVYVCLIRSLCVRTVCVYCDYSPIFKLAVCILTF